jgi:hypothetical protein
VCVCAFDITQVQKSIQHTNTKPPDKQFHIFFQRKAGIKGSHSFCSRIMVEMYEGQEDQANMLCVPKARDKLNCCASSTPCKAFQRVCWRVSWFFGLWPFWYHSRTIARIPTPAFERKTGRGSGKVLYNTTSTCRISICCNLFIPAASLVLTVHVSAIKFICRFE